MKHFNLVLFGTVAFLGLFCTGVSAADIQPQQGLISSGTLGIEGGARFYKETDGSTNSDDDILLGGSGTFSIPLGESFSAQLDGDAEFYLGGHGNDDISEGAHAFGGHLSWRNPDSGLLGIFAGGAVASIDDDEDGDHLGFIVGGEGQLYLDSVTLYGQAGYGDIKVDSNEGFKGFFVRGVGRFFLSDDTLLQAELGYGGPSTFVDGDSGDIFNWGLEAETRLLDATPIYGTLGYRGGHYDSPSDGDHTEEHVGYVGLTFLFGANSLKENDRYGATLDLPMLPSRAASWVEAID